MIFKIWIKFINDPERSNNKRIVYEEVILNERQNQFCNGLENLEIFEIQSDTPCCCFFASDKRFYRTIMLDVDYFEEFATMLYVEI